ncbi:mucin-5AC isoform X2 [Aethina tumida]|uniref:mucin-5AC isoform X2 n=1 Tax=Aethina tumida TaxID=116153 RepID=UPI00096B5CD4|nr:mucin-5AC isoform X2 [Aethina tumida]
MAKSSQTGKKLEKNLRSNSEVPKHNTIMPPPQTIVNENAQMTGQRTGITESVSEVLGHGTRRRNISSDQISKTDNRDVSHQIREMVGQRTGITERAPDVSERSTRRRNISSDQIPETDNGDVSRQMREISCPRSNSEDPKPDTVMSPPQTIENQNTQMAGQRTAITESAPDVSRRRTHKRNISSDEISKTDNRDVSRQMREISCLRSNSEDPKPDTVMPPPQTIVNQNTQMAEQRTGITESVPDVSRRRTHKRNISSDEIPKTDNRDVSRQMREISCLRSNSEDPKPDTVMPPPQTIENQNTQMAGQGTAITESAPDVSRRRTHKRNISSDEIPKTDNRDVSRQMREISCLRSNSEDPKPDTVMPPPQTIENQNTQMVGQRTAITESAPDVSRRRTHKRNISSDEIPKTDNRDVSRQMREISCLRSNSEDPKPDTVMPPPQTIENQNTQMAGQRTAITESAPDVSRRRTHKRNISSDEIPKTDNRDVSRQIRETFGTGHPNTMTFQVEHSTPTSIKLRRTIGGTSDLKCSTVEYPTISAPRTSPPVEKPKTKVKRMRHPCHRHHRPSIYGDNPPATIRRGPSSAGGTRDYTVTPPSPMYSVRTSPFALVSKQFHQRMYVNGRMPVTVGIKPSTDGSTTKFISTSPVTTMYPVPKPTPSSNTPKTDHTAKSRQPDNEIPPRSGLESNSQIPAPRRTLAPLPTEQNFSTSDLARCINLQATQTSTMSKKDKAKAKKQKLDNKKN